MTYKRVAAVTANSGGATSIMKLFSHIVHRYINSHKSNSSRVHIIKNPTIEVILHDLIVPTLVLYDIRAVNSEFSVFITAERDSNAHLDSILFGTIFSVQWSMEIKTLTKKLNSHSSVRQMTRIYTVFSSI